MAVPSFFKGVPPRMIDALTNKERGTLRKPRRYFEPYDFLFNRFIGKRPKVLELGVEHGGSLYLWKRYFQNAEVYGTDIELSCKQYEGENVHVLIGDNNNQEFLELVASFGPFDIIVDDASHQKEDIIGCFEFLFPHLNDGGFYAIEDIGTSYWEPYGGPLGIMEYFKLLLDDIHAPFIGDYSGCCKESKEKFPEIDTILFLSCLCIIGKKLDTNHCGGDDIVL